MAVTVCEHKDEEQRMLVSLLKHFDWEVNECYQNVMLFPWESDMLVVSASGYVTEVEVKCSLTDWRADSKKKKFVDPYQAEQFKRRVKRFYYAVTTKVYEQHVQQPVEVPEEAGLLVYGHGGFPRFSEVRAPKNRPAKPITDAERQRLLRSVYFRFNRQYIKGLPKAVPVKSKAWT